MNAVLAKIHFLATKRHAKCMGMMSGLVQYTLEGSSESLQKECQSLAEEIMRIAEPECAIVWTIQKCSIGLFGSDALIHHAAIVPNFKEMLAALHLGQIKYV